jgi:hypothetical protein
MGDIQTTQTRVLPEESGTGSHRGCTFRRRRSHVKNQRCGRRKNFGHPNQLHRPPQRHRRLRVLEIALGDRENHALGLIAVMVPVPKCMEGRDHHGGIQQQKHDQQRAPGKESA